MDMKLLRAFVTLAEQGSYHAAAETLYLTQPALTKQIQTLEHLTGVSLFHRGRHGAKLTVTGKLLYSRSSELLQHYDEFLEYARRVQKGNAGKLALGFGISSFQLAPAWVNIFRERLPDVEVSLNDIPSNVQCQMLLEGQLQAGFIRLPVTEPLEAKVLMEEKLVLAVPSGVQVDPANIQPVLETHPLLQISPHRGRGLAEQASRFLKENNLSARPASAADDIHTLLALIAAGNGVALLPAGVSHFQPTGVTLVQPEGKHTGWRIGIAWNPKIQDALRDKFLQMVTAIK
ncbi:LysR family transcriptional regulator [Brenneria tiliae]|uniref:LysR family transcriptional regulator n=1 Tax=Brenneria tiliae TaxID=2914984 RepID=UPI0020149C10|nr:LysR family transcriptional regulator [Brenneria tiliae]MCL2897860.1 LysR family transcriptional regulator [Brenneria tiliae]MCL2902457.1 LysR family transcriptional regulator [Brenneria tiliae]